MGIDTLELIMNVEDAFDIKIHDDDAQRLATVGELYDYVVERTALALPGTCLTASTFYALQDGMRKCDVTKRFGPSTKLSDVIPPTGRRRFWHRLGNSTQLRLPKLVRPGWLVSTNAVLIIGASASIAYIVMGIEDIEVLSPLIGIICLFVFGYVTTFITEPLATQIDTSFDSFRGLSEQVLALNRAKLKKEHGAMGRGDIWVLLREIIVDCLGVDHDEIERNANFVKDLGCE